MLALRVTQGVDASAVDSVEALTLLQLVQTPPIDMGSRLPYEALAQITGSEETLLSAVVLLVPDPAASPAPPFAATLLGGVPGAETTASWVARRPLRHSQPATLCRSFS